MSGFRIEGNTSGNVVEVSSDNELQVTLPQVKSHAGLACILSENDDGTYNGGSKLRLSPSTSMDRRLTVGLDTPLFDYAFTATAQDTGIWRHVFTTMTCTQSGGYVLFNSAAIGTATTGASLGTWRAFSMVNNSGMTIEIVGNITNTLPANQVVELGWFAPGTPTVAPTEGVYFRLSSAGLVGVVNFNGVESVSEALDTSQILANVNCAFQLKMYTDIVQFWMNDHFLGSVSTPDGNPQATMTLTLPVCITMRNSGTVTGAQQFKLGHVSVNQRDTQLALPYEQQLAIMGLMGSQATSGNTQGSTALYTNSLAPGAGVVMTNTTAALGVGLGGQFAALPTLAANTDGILCSFQVPVGTVNIRPRTLVIRGVRIQGAVTTVLVGNATPVIYAFGLSYGHTAVSMATAESASFTTATAKAPRRVPLGYESYAATAALGTLGSAGVYMQFYAPIVVNPGEFVAITAKNVGVVTSTGVITFLVTYDCFWM